MAEYRRRDDQEREAGGYPTHRRPLEVIVDERGVEAAMRAFKRLVLREGILRDVKRKASYESQGGGSAGRFARRRAGVASKRPAPSGVRMASRKSAVRSSAAPGIGLEKRRRTHGIESVRG